MSVDYLLRSHSSGRTIIFDLDNTIYDETEFLFRAYQYLSYSLFSNRAHKVFSFLKEEFQSSGRKKIFDKMFLQFPEDGLNINDCLIKLREYKCNNCIKTFSWFSCLLNKVDRDFRLRIITNGNVKQQRNKISSIEFNYTLRASDVVFSNNTNPKPSPESYYLFSDFRNFNDPIYVGNSLTDKEFSNNCGIEFYDVGKLV